MIILIWTLAVILLGFWSLLAWLSYRLLQWAGQLPWDQTLQYIRDISVPAVVAPWWNSVVDILAPLLQMSQGLLTGLMQFAGAALPFFVAIVWLMGAAVVVVAAVAATGGMWWFKRRRLRNA